VWPIFVAKKIAKNDRKKWFCKNLWHRSSLKILLIFSQIRLAPAPRGILPQIWKKLNHFDRHLILISSFLQNRYFAIVILQSLFRGVKLLRYVHINTWSKLFAN
jgi:hypothetical protein